jgi:hypothetical protein
VTARETANGHKRGGRYHVERRFFSEARFSSFSEAGNEEIAFLLGNFLGRLYRFDTEGVEKTKKANVRQAAGRCGLGGSRF